MEKGDKVLWGTRLAVILHINGNQAFIKLLTGKNKDKINTSLGELKPFFKKKEQDNLFRCPDCKTPYPHYRPEAVCPNCGYLHSESFRNFLNESVSDYYPKLFKKLESLPDDVVVHFSNIPKVGINPNPSHHDPLGIYAFPKKYVLSNNFVRNHQFFQMPYIFFLKPKKGIKILNLSKVSMSEVQRMLKLNNIPEGIIDKTSLNPFPHRFAVGSFVAGHLLWDSIEKFMYENNYTRNQKNIYFYKFFKNSGYEALYDEGDSIIHSNEPSQMVFLNRSVFDVVDSITSKTGVDLQKQAAMKVMNIISKELFGENNYKLISRNDRNIRMTITSYGPDYKNFYFTYDTDRHWNQFSGEPTRYLYGYLAAYSELEKNSSKSIDVHFPWDAESFKEYLDPIIKKFKNYFSNKDDFYENKNEEVKKLGNEIVSLFGFQPKVTKEFSPDEFTFTKNYNFGSIKLNLMYKNPSMYSEDKNPYYQLNMNFKPKNSYYSASLYGKSMLFAPDFEQMSLTNSAKRLIQDCLKEWENAIMNNYDPDPSKHKYNASQYAEIGKNLIKLLNFMKKKINRNS